MRFMIVVVLWIVHFIYLYLQHPIHLRSNQNGDLFQSLSCLLVITRYPMHDAERIHCRYCMQQYQKVMSGKFHQHSSYCPLKLFSINRDEQIQAMESLFETSQNNLVFRLNGCKVVVWILFDSSMICHIWKSVLIHLYQIVTL